MESPNNETHPYTIKVKAATSRAVQAKIDGLGITVWLPRSQVVMPEQVRPGDVLEVEIPAWLIRNEIGQPF